MSSGRSSSRRSRAGRSSSSRGSPAPSLRALVDAVLPPRGRPLPAVADLQRRPRRLPADREVAPVHEGVVVADELACFRRRVWMVVERPGSPRSSSERHAAAPPSRSPRVDLDPADAFGSSASNSSAPCTFLKCLADAGDHHVRAQNSAAVLPGLEGPFRPDALRSTAGASAQPFRSGTKKRTRRPPRPRGRPSAPCRPCRACRARFGTSSQLALDAVVAAALAGGDEESHDAEHDEDESDPSHESSFAGS